MNPRFARLRPDATVDEAIRYLRKQMTEQPRTIYYAYVLDAEQPTAHEPRRIIHEAAPEVLRYYHQVKLADAWADVYEFTGSQ